MRVDPAPSKLTREEEILAIQSYLFVKNKWLLIFLLMICCYNLPYVDRCAEIWDSQVNPQRVTVVLQGGESMTGELSKGWDDFYRLKTSNKEIMFKSVPVMTPEEPIIRSWRSWLPYQVMIIIIFMLISEILDWRNELVRLANKYKNAE